MSAPVRGWLIWLAILACTAAVVALAGCAHCPAGHLTCNFD